MALAQEAGTIVSGRILDAADGAPVGFVSVVVQVDDSGVQFTGTLTDEDGRFVIQGLPPDTYTVATSFPGYYAVDVALFVGELNQIFDLGDIQLDRLETFAEEVTVTAEASRAAGIDTQVFRLDDGAAQTTGSLLDAMRNLPGVTVDQDGVVSLRGSNRVAILIDGRQSSLTGFGNQRGLDSVSAANIEAIEIINNPSARFDAAGMAGIINIIYRQEQELGLSGDVGVVAGPGTVVEAAERPADRTRELREQPEGHSQPEPELQHGNRRYYDDGRVIESQVPENREQTHYVVRAGSDWTLDASNVLSVSGVYDFETHTDRAQVPFILQSTGERERFWFWREKEDTGFANISVDWERQFATPGHEMGMNPHASPHFASIRSRRKPRDTPAVP